MFIDILDNIKNIIILYLITIMLITFIQIYTINLIKI
jgi:hypothetical protein